jgi:DNA mismatch repair protein MSH2|tara:strand:- start:2026 stop:4815 length:2790 start_codon:yes stop_codon:yes gene_type:complete
VFRIFNRKEFYSVHGDDAFLVARNFFKTTTVIRYLGHGESALPVVTMSRGLFETVLRELLLESSVHLVELYEENPREGWRLSRSASPGKLGAFEDELYRSSEMLDIPIVTAVRVTVQMGQRHVGVASFNPNTRHLGACEFIDDEQLCSLEAMVCQLGAKECVLPCEKPETPDGRRLREIIKRCGALPTDLNSAHFDVHHLERDLSHILAKEDEASIHKASQSNLAGTFVVEKHRAILEKRGAAAALAALLRFCEILSDPINHGRCTLSMHDDKKYVRLDASALRALNVFPERKSQASSSIHPGANVGNQFSLYDLLNRCRFSTGRRTLLRWLKQPLVSAEEIRQRHDVVEALVGDPEVRDTLRGTHLRALPDIERITRKLERRTVNLVDLCKLYQASTVLPHIVGTLNRIDSKHSHAIRARYSDKLNELHDRDHLGRYEALIEAAVNLDRIPEEYVICASYDPQLKELQILKDATTQEIHVAFREAAVDLQIPAEKILKLESNNLHGWYLRLTKKDETAVRKKLSASYQVLEAKKDGTKFTNKKLRLLSLKYLELGVAYEKRQRHLLDRVMDVAATFVDVFLQITYTCAEIDVLASFAEVAVSAAVPFTRPNMLSNHDVCTKGDGLIILKESRHPCLEAQSGALVIPNTCELVDGKSWFQIITGPNMGGKSTFIRQVGICVLLAQIGSFVPCESAEITIRDAIFARVGAGDCQLRGISTFMAEMLETSAIIKGATPSSLIIIDELGRGTSTYDGFGLAWAISDHIVNHVKAPCLFATHFHELTGLQGQGGVANYHVDTKIDPKSRKLTMLYRVLPGSCARSFGVDCAEYAKFPQDIIDKARQKASELEDFSDETVVGDVHMVKSTHGGLRSKRKRLHLEVGSSHDLDVWFATRARSFLHNFAALSLHGISVMDVAKCMQHLKNELEVFM